ITPRYIVWTVYLKLHPGDPVERVTLGGQGEWQVGVDEEGHDVTTGDNGLDFVPAQFNAMKLTGKSATGEPITMTLDSTQLSIGQIQELQNSTAGTLDLPPFTPTGSASSYFDIFANVQIGTQQYHMATPMHLSGNLSSLPPSASDALLGDSTGSSTPLLDATGTDSGIALSSQDLNLNPTLTVVADAPQCPANITAIATSTSGTTVNYSVTELFGDCPFGHHLDCTPASGSTFPIGTTTVTCTASDDCGLSNTCSFTVTVLPAAPSSEWFFASDYLPPPNSSYTGRSTGPRHYDDVKVRFLMNERLSKISTSVSPPGDGAPPATCSFDAQFDADISDDGITYRPVTAKARGIITVKPSSGSTGASRIFDTEMLQLEVSGGTLPAGVMLRESPTKASLGQTTIRQVGGGFLIGSFFDVFTEMSMDGGTKWSAASALCVMEMIGSDPEKTSPPVLVSTSQFPPPMNGFVVVPDRVNRKLVFVSGSVGSSSSMVIQNPRFTRFSSANYLDLAVITDSADGDYMCGVQFDLSTDGGNTFEPISGSAHVTFKATTCGSTTPVIDRLSACGAFGIEITGTGSSGNTVRLRESPTLPSSGMASVRDSSSLRSLYAFFDIFTELSMDDGTTWMAADLPLHVDLQQIAMEQPVAQSDFSLWPGSHISEARAHQNFATSATISNLVLSAISPAGSPPAPGTSQQYTVTLQAQFMMSQDNGNTFVQCTVPGSATVKVNSTILDQGDTRFFETELLTLSLDSAESTGRPPGGWFEWRFRESPSRPSLGRTSMTDNHTHGTPSVIGSFFDIWPELSLNGGQTWLPADSSATVSFTPHYPGPTSDAPLCPSNMTVYASSSSGATVNYTVLELFGDCPFGHHLDCTPASGSTLPIGTTTVTCTAWDDCHLTNTCTFTVTVVDISAFPIVDWYFPFPSIRPINGKYYLTSVTHRFCDPKNTFVANLTLENFDQGASPPVLGDSPQSDTFTCDASLDISRDGGQTYTPATAKARGIITVKPGTGGTTAGRSYDTEIVELEISGGTLPTGMMLRESPTRQSLGKTQLRTVDGDGINLPHVETTSSFFDVFTELSTDGGQTWGSCSSYEPPMHLVLEPALRTSDEAMEPTELLPPPCDAYLSSSNTPIRSPSSGELEIIIQRVVCKLPSQSVPPPGVGQTLDNNFEFDVQMDVSTDTGATFQTAKTKGVCVCSIALPQSPVNSGGKLIKRIELEVTKFDVATGALMIRESPTKASLGRTVVTTQSDGTYRIGSFFDVFVEVSQDGGQTWVPSQGPPVRFELQQQAGEGRFSGENCPPAGSAFITSSQWSGVYENGVIISNLTQSQFSQSFPPPSPGVSQSATFTSQMDLMLSLDSGHSFVHVSGLAEEIRENDNVTFDVQDHTRFFDTEVLSLSLSLPNGVMLRESPSKASLGRTSLRDHFQDGDIPNEERIASFFDIFTEISLDGGQTWSASKNGPATLSLIPHYTSPVPDAPLCPSNITVYASTSTGAVVDYTVLELFGDCPFGHRLASAPPSGSTFPIGTTTVTCTATDDCGLSNSCSFTVTVIDRTTYPIVDWFFQQNSLRPAGAQFAALIDSAITYPDDRNLLGLKLYDVTDSISPPVLGSGPQTDTFTCAVEMRIADSQSSRDIQATAAGVIKWEKVDNTDAISAEMLSLTISGGTLPQGMMLRESPTLQSKGQTTVRQVNGGYMISSFFDVFTEVSLDGGQTWSAAQQPMHLEMVKSMTGTPVVSEPTTLLPPPCDSYSSPAGYSARFTTQNANGGTQQTIIGGLRCKLPSQSSTPPTPGQTSSENFSVQLDVLLSTDNGQSFHTERVIAQRTDALTVLDEFRFNHEIQSYSFTSTAGLMFRESPTLRSGGVTRIVPQADGTYQMSRFFDVFLEMSADGGQTWIASETAPIRHELEQLAPEQPFGSAQFLTVEQRFRSGTRYWSFACDKPDGSTFRVVMSNVVVQNFNKPVSLPQPGDPPQTNRLYCQTICDLSLDGGQTYLYHHAQGELVYRVASAGPNTALYDTEILQLNISGGDLPNGVMLRESPSKASLGRTSVRSASTSNGGTIFEISSFFDIFTEISLDGGQTWTASDASMTTVLSAPACPNLVIDPPVLPYALAGGSYSQIITASNGVAPYTFAITAGTLPSGFSVSAGGALAGNTTTAGSSTLTITATDANGCSSSQDYILVVNTGCPGTKPPTVTITSPSATTPATTGTILLKGSATDDTGIDRVLVSLDRTGYKQADIMYGGGSHKTATWSIPLTFTAAGKHEVRVTAQDQCGNVSATTKTFFYVVPTTMTLTVNGSGSVSGPAKLVVGPNTLNPGQVYKFSAVPAPNNLFSNL
ncbi:MAG: hypothetical protein JWO95_476, partial [Verrucomicrobiales bacterium]|nr:hypothetical protein [Verrucomicrobiales bacterium]